MVLTTHVFDLVPVQTEVFSWHHFIFLSLLRPSISCLLQSALQNFHETVRVRMVMDGTVETTSVYIVSCMCQVLHPCNMLVLDIIVPLHSPPLSFTPT
jgi:hypothetical protein